MGPLDGFVQSVQTGLNSISGTNAPDVHVLYSRDTSEAKQYQLTRPGTTAIPPGVCNVSTNCQPHVGTMIQQIGDFLNSTPVTTSLANNKGPVYVLIGAHGKAAAGFSIYPLLFNLLLRLFVFFNWRCRWFNLMVNWLRVIPTRFSPGIAFPRSRSSTSSFLTLNDLSTLLNPIGPASLVLHSCVLGGIEAIYELRSVRQLITCESDLNGSMDASQWFDNINHRQPLGKLAAAATGFQAEGIFASWKTTNPKAMTRLLTAINGLGACLKAQLLTVGSTAISNARLASLVSENTVDLWQFCEQLSPVCAKSCALMQTAIQRLQSDRVLTTVFLNDPTKRYFHGMSVYLPPTGSVWNVNDLPTNFRTDANQWVDFLSEWQH
jgi:hypothetical protein